MTLIAQTRNESRRDPASARKARKILGRSAVVLLDWDGCVALGDRPVEGAIAFLSEWPGRAAIVSNNSTHLPEDFATILARAGVEMALDRIVLAGVEAIERAREIGADRVLMLGDSRMKAHARRRGLNLVSDGADLVVLLRDRRFSYAKLERAASCLRTGARLVVSNPDLTHPGAAGRIAPETGALRAALLACLADIDIEGEVIGKPGPRLFDHACRALGAPRESAVMIGDNPATDIAGAEALGLESILIGPQSGLRFEDLLRQPAAPGLRLAKAGASHT